MAPISDVDGGSVEERKELLDKYFEEVDMNDDKLLSQIVLSHYWSGELGYGKGWPFVYVREWASFADAEDNKSLAKAREDAWPDEEERKAFFDKLGKYFAPGHKDIAVHTNWVKLAKR